MYSNVLYNRLILVHRDKTAKLHGKKRLFLKQAQTPRSAEVSPRPSTTFRGLAEATLVLKVED
jgi:hypothetical protein